MDRADVIAGIDRELALTIEQKKVLSARKASGTLKVAALILAALNLSALVILPSYGPIWIVSTLLITLVISVLAILPTTRSTAGIGGILIPVKKLRDARTVSKRLLTALLISTFLAGGLPLVPGMVALLAMSVLFAIMLLLSHPSLFIPILWVMVQCLLILFFYIWLMRQRPYSDEFLERLLGTLSSIRKGERGDRLRPLLELGEVVVISSTLLIGVFILPGMTLKIITAEAPFALMNYLLPFLLILITHVLIVRWWQGKESRRWAEAFLRNKEAVLRAAHDDLIKGGDVGANQERLLASRLLRLQSHDLFGHLPVFSLFPDLDLLLTKDLQDQLALIKTSEALRNTGL